MDRGAWWSTVHRVRKKSDTTERLTATKLSQVDSDTWCQQRKQHASPPLFYLFSSRRGRGTAFNSKLRVRFRSTPHHLYSISSVAGEAGELHLTLSCELGSDPLRMCLCGGGAEGASATQKMLFYNGQ